jgi:hypothetical protein
MSNALMPPLHHVPPDEHRWWALVARLLTVELPHSRFAEILQFARDGANLKSV